jgi:5-methylcytosine-specific restriction protein B
MTDNQLIQELRRMYEGAPDGYKVTFIHLFGIKYAEELQDMKMSYKELAKAALEKESYHTEIHKGAKLATYVSVKTGI